jgi:hypothetical protein
MKRAAHNWNCSSQGRLHPYREVTTDSMTAMCHRQRTFLYRRGPATLIAAPPRPLLLEKAALLAAVEDKTCRWPICRHLRSSAEMT